MARPRCFFDITIDSQQVGRIIFELFSDVVPKTAENFRSLCLGDRGKGAKSGMPLCYRGSPFHRVIKNFMIQGGDITSQDGRGGESIYGATFEDENFVLKHGDAGLLSMANKGPGTNSSQFFITTRPAPHLDNKHVIFGRVLKGMDIVKMIENTHVTRGDKPVADIRVHDCGELVLKRKQPAKETQEQESEKRKQKDSSESSGSDSESDSSSDDSDSGSSDSDDSEQKRNKEKKKAKKEKKKAKKEKRKQKKEEKKRRKEGKSAEQNTSDKAENDKGTHQNFPHLCDCHFYFLSWFSHSGRLSCFGLSTSFVVNSLLIFT
eukprot:TRINITY_DN3625_c0_g1_i1.p1 TRINITY_DN3625_c0_g1~~TRINITY_DN3625_c0_g1_i1.p1  ORF type:complete len:320 (+),score=80.11 TRINITY_DN3625_c0_g1_i1:51-1010(+)